MAHLFLDQEPNRPSPYTQTTRSATFIEQYEPGWGQVRIDDENTTSLVDVRLLPGVYAKGAQVGLVCGHDGRPIHATPPQTVADDATPIGVGTSGEYTIEAKTEAGEAKKDAADALADSAQASNAAREANEAAKKAWDEASSARESIAAVDSSARAAVQAANNAEQAAGLTQAALDAAKEAQRLENEALKAATDAAASEAKTAQSKATQAQSVADQAAGQANAAKSAADEAAGKASEAQSTAEAARAKADDLAKQAQEAMKTAQAAQTSADGKALVAYSTYQPATIRGQKIIWFKPGSVPMLYDGATWRSVQPGDGVVQALNIDKATVGELSGMRIKAGTASVDILIPGENARWSSSGLTIYHPLTPEQRQAGIKPTDWDKRATALNLTSDGARFISVADEAGTVTAYMSPQGEVSGRELTITGPANVDTLKVGGLDLTEVISLNSSLAAYTVVPDLVHPAGFDSAIMAQTGWQAFSPGLYAISWNVGYQYVASGSKADAAGAYLQYQSRPMGGDTITDENFVLGNRKAFSWQNLWGGAQYSVSFPTDVFEAKAGKEYRFTLGLHSYYKWKLTTWASVFKVERLNSALELTHTLYNQSAPPAPPAPKIVTASAGLSQIWYAYGSTFAQSGSYQSGGNFHIPGAKGKKIINIRLTGRCNFDFMDGGSGRDFSFHLGGENRSQKIYDYGAVDIPFGATAAATLSRQGYVGFRLNNGAPAYNEYNPSSFRCTVTYQ